MSYLIKDDWTCNVYHIEFLVEICYKLMKPCNIEENYDFKPFESRQISKQVKTRIKVESGTAQCYRLNSIYLILRYIEFYLSDSHAYLVSFVAIEYSWRKYILMMFSRISMKYTWKFTLGYNNNDICFLFSFVQFSIKSGWN